MPGLELRASRVALDAGDVRTQASTVLDLPNSCLGLHQLLPAPGVLAVGSAPDLNRSQDNGYLATTDVVHFSDSPRPPETGEDASSQRSAPPGLVSSLLVVSNLTLINRAPSVGKP